MTSFAIDGDPADHDPAWLVGLLDDIAAQLRLLEQASVDRVCSSTSSTYDLETVERLGRELIPAVR